MEAHQRGGVDGGRTQEPLIGSREYPRCFSRPPLPFPSGAQGATYAIIGGCVSAHPLFFRVLLRLLRMGNPMPPTFCPQCRAETRDGARFCYACGTALVLDAAQVAPMTAPAMAGSVAAGMPHVTSGASSVAPAAFPYPPHNAPFAPPPYAPVPPYAAPIATPQRSRAAVAGFCLGLATVIIGWALTWVGTIIGVCGLVFSLIGLRETGRRAALLGNPRFGRGLAIAGAILSLIGIALSLALLIYILTHLADFGIVWPAERTR